MLPAQQLESNWTDGHGESRIGPQQELVPLQIEEDFIKANPEWVKELEIMTQTKVKAEIQALSSFGFQYLSQVYLPLKLQEGDWI